MADKKNKGRLRQGIEDSILRAEQERNNELLKRRLEFAKQGLHAYELRQYKEAVNSFDTYIAILENWKKVARGKLHPSNFDREIEMSELLLIGGIFWEMAKLYDQAPNEVEGRDVKQYLDKYVTFSKGMPFEAIASESLRKHIAYRNPNQKDAFKAAYRELAGSNCFVATALLDVTEPMTRQRLYRFRDEGLAQRFWGRIFIRLYYRTGPVLAFLVNRLPFAPRKKLGKALDLFSKWVA
jgi:hypothetical protein